MDGRGIENCINECIQLIFIDCFDMLDIYVGVREI